MHTHQKGPCATETKIISFEQSIFFSTAHDNTGVISSRTGDLHVPPSHTPWHQWRTRQRRRVRSAQQRPPGRPRLRQHSSGRRPAGRGNRGSFPAHSPACRGSGICPPAPSRCTGCRHRTASLWGPLTGRPSLWPPPLAVWQPRRRPALEAAALVPPWPTSHRAVPQRSGCPGESWHMLHQRDSIRPCTTSVSHAARQPGWLARCG